MEKSKLENGMVHSSRSLLPHWVGEYCQLRRMIEYCTVDRFASII